MLNQCPNSIPCPGSDFPVTNFSSEAADTDVFIGINTGWDWNLPPLGSSFYAVFCKGICESTLSQQDADLCAARASLLCVMYSTGGGTESGGGGALPGAGPWSQNGKSIPTFGNQLIQCSSQCPDGTMNSYVVSPGTFIARSQDAANNMANSYACFRAREERICINDLDTTMCVANSPSDPEQSVQLTAQSALPVSWTASGLPAGMVCEPDGTVHGVPLSAGNFPFNATATNSDGASKTKQLTLNVFGLNVTNHAIPSSKVDHFYSYQLTATGGVGFVVFDFLGSDFPGGVTGDANGLISGTPNAVGTYPVMVTMTDSMGNVCTQSVSWTVTGPKFTNSPPNGQVCTTYTTTTITTSPSGSTFTATGLPPGLTMNAGGTISGKPTSSGNYAAFITATNGGQTNDITYSINVVKLAGDQANPAGSVDDLVWVTFQTDVDPGTSSSFGGSGGVVTILSTGGCNPPSSLGCTQHGVAWLQNCSGHDYTLNFKFVYTPSTGAQCNGNSPSIFVKCDLDNSGTILINGTATVPATFNAPFVITNGSSHRIEFQARGIGNGTGSCSLTITPSTPP